MPAKKKRQNHKLYYNKGWQLLEVKFL